MLTSLLLILSCSESHDKCRQGTGVMGKMKIIDEDSISIVLLTNYHVIAPEEYEMANPTEISPSMKQEIEKCAEGSRIKLSNGKTINLSEGMLVNGSSIISPKKSVRL